MNCDIPMSLDNDYSSSDTDTDYEFDDIEIFKKDEEGFIVENALYLIENTIVKNALVYNDPNFEENIKNDIIDLFEQQLYQVYYDFDESFREDFREELDLLVSYSFKMFYKHISPKRSFKKTFIRKEPNKSRISTTIEHLINKPQPEQKSEEWYKFRYNTLTASNIWKAFGTQSSINQLIYEKCNHLNTNKFGSSINTPMHWGHKYEPISVMVYEKCFKTKIGEFGCISHDHYDFIAASPDGINIDETSSRYGRMLEIKNIVNREINGIPKLEYWIQMQIQMEVCNLNECDFLETRFVEYESISDFENDGTFNYTNNKKLKGIVMMFYKDNVPIYIYPPLKLNSNEFEKWEMETMIKHHDLFWLRNIYWKLEDVSCVLVLRNKMWFEQAIPILNDLWDTIKREKLEGYEHRAPKRKNTRKNNNEETMDDSKNKCFIDISSLT
jgi:putative phage-type endonuclease